MLLNESILLLAGLVALSRKAAALATGDAEAMFNAYNNAFLIARSPTEVYYKAALNTQNVDQGWTGALDIQGAEDAYDRTGDPAKKALVNDLLTTFLIKNSPPNLGPWDQDGWNDDMGWYALALIRGYLITRNENFYTQGKYAFDLAFGRGWDTQYNGGGIWELDPAQAAQQGRAPAKEALSNDSLGKAACYLFQAKRDSAYLGKCQQIYDWTRSHLYNTDTGQVYTGVYTDGSLVGGSDVYNQGAFIDFAGLVYETTGSPTAHDDAKRALDYGRNHMTNNGIFSDSGGHNTWADEMARGVGHFVAMTRLWDEYYSWMVQNADSVLANRRSDLGITWNVWDRSTPTDNTGIATNFVGAVSWLQYTPATKPSNIGGMHVITNQQTGYAIDSGASYILGGNVFQWGANWGQNQRWRLSQNSDNSWTIYSLGTFLALDCAGGAASSNDPVIQYLSHRENNQRWWIEQQSDGSYKIQNQASGKVLDGYNTLTYGDPLRFSDWTGAASQRWIIQ
ncbi:glycoside hydrolase family 76 protein [Thozetella sp. PMI_491]|nr:glycoside hydrolase family 76 protein [Thozetella sp. PMI_491]